MPDKKFSSKANIVVTKTRRRTKPEEEKKSSLTTKRPISKQRLRKADTRRKRKTGLIEFYDLGNILNGTSYETIPPHQVIPPFQYTPVIGGFINGYIRDLLADDYLAVDAWILGNGVATFKTQFKKIKKGAVSQSSAEYRLIVAKNADASDFALLDDRPDWTTDGLEVTQAEATSGIAIGNGVADNPTPNYIASVDLAWFRMTTYSLVDLFWLREDATQKITALPTFGAVAVPFTPSPNMKVYLMPELASTRGHSGIQRAAGFDYSWLNDFYMVQPREWMLPSNAHYRKYGFENLYPTQSTPSEYANNITIMQGFETLPNTRGEHNSNDLGTVSSGFLYNPTNAIGYPQMQDWGVQWNVPAKTADPTKGFLVAVVEKDSSYYYFWKKL